MYRYLEWIQLNIGKSLGFLFLLNLIASFSKLEILSNIVATFSFFAASLIFFSYGISLIRLGFVTKVSNVYSKWEQYITAGFALIAGLLILFVTVSMILINNGILK